MTAPRPANVSYRDTRKETASRGERHVTLGDCGFRRDFRRPSTVIHLPHVTTSGCLPPQAPEPAGARALARQRTHGTQSPKEPRKIFEISVLPIGNIFIPFGRFSQDAQTFPAHP